MSGAAEFAAAILPTLLEFGRELFRSSGGNVQKARRHIRSRIDDVKAERAKIDAEMRRRFGK